MIIKTNFFKIASGSNEYQGTFMMLLIQLALCHLGFSSLYFMNYDSCLHLTSNKCPAGLPGWLNGKGSACQCQRCRFDPWNGKTPRGGNGNLLQDSCLKSSMDRGTWRATVHGVTKESNTTWRLNNQNNNRVPINTVALMLGRPIMECQLPYTLAFIYLICLWKSYRNLGKDARLLERHPLYTTPFLSLKLYFIKISYLL